jgi:hypothetical protein
LVIFCLKMEVGVLMQAFLLLNVDRKQTSRPPQKRVQSKGANYRLVLETSGLFLRPMPSERPEQFSDKCLPISQDGPNCPNLRGAFASVGSAGKEVNMYAPFISMVPCLTNTW